MEYNPQVVHKSFSKNRPLVYQWICKYNDGSILSQFDNNKSRPTTIINSKPLSEFILRPFTLEEEKRINSKDNILVKSIPFLPKYTLKLDDLKRAIYYRQVFIQIEEYHKCLECGKEFYYSPTLDHIGGKYPSPICPHCGAHDYFYCSKCNKRFIFEETNMGSCPICGGGLKRKKITSEQFTREKRWIEYYIGYQYTKNNKNYKFLMKILENGDCEVLGD